jgi:F0F1-type ATP synthase epsilon subunit
VKDNRVDVLAEHAEMGGDVEEFRERRKKAEEREEEQAEEREEER